jgi:hypothetical protein
VEVKVKMAANQGCKKCRANFSEDSDERNYRNYAKFGFPNQEKFRKHNAGNKNCPYKQLNLVDNIPQEDNFPHNHNPIWLPPKKNIIEEEDYVFDQEINQRKLKKHNRNGRPLWFRETEEAAADILSLILLEYIQWITLVAEPGSGKTMVAHLLIYMISNLPYDKSINKGSITITTGMSDTEWYKQLISNFELKDGDYLWNEIHKVDTNHCIVHRSNFHKRIAYLLNHQEFLSNHVFIIDESHFADDELMTIDDQLKRLGLTEDRMKEYNIKVLFISATPDVNLSLMISKDNHKLVQLENGEGYNGFKKHNSIGRIIDDGKINDLGDFIRSKYSTPRYHYIRARTQQDKGQHRTNVSDCCAKNGWILIEDDSDNNIYISFCEDERERNAFREGKQVIKTYNSPVEHTLILIKNKYQASKRLQVTPYTGIIYEKKSKKRNATVTCNGLIPRFFGYYDWPTFNNNEQALFICDKQSVEEYIKFAENFIYEGKDYAGTKIKSDRKKTRQIKNTCYGCLADITPVIIDKSINISAPFDKDKDIQRYLLEDMGFEQAGISVTDNCGGVRGEDGYMYPKRNVPGHTRNEPDNTFLTEEIYKLKFVNKGGGSFINKKPGEGGSGQSFMVYPVYKDTDSEPEDYKYYVHSLKI